MEVVLGVGFFLAAVFWLTAVFSFVMAARHRKPEISWTTLAFNGLKFFDAENFTAAGQKHQRRGLIAMLGFLAAGFLAFAVAIVTQGF